MLLDYLPQILNGTWVTIQVTIAALILGMLLGIIAAVGEAAKNKFVRYIFTGVISVIRGVPELLVLFFIYFGGTIILTKIFGTYINISSFIAGVVALGLIFAAYASQTLRGAFAEIPTGQMEAGKALGLSSFRVFIKILLPQAWRHALPGLGNLFLVLLKDSALVSLIGLSDLMNKTQLAANSTHEPFTFFLVAALIYLVLTSFSQLLLKFFTVRAERHMA